jgi:hypothetical protein
LIGRRGGSEPAAAPPPALEAGGTGSELRRAVTDATTRIQEIIDTAERVAVQIRTDAEASAGAYLEERRRAADLLVAEQMRVLAALAHELSDHAASLGRQSETIVAALEGAVARLRTASVSPGPERAHHRGAEAGVPAEAPGPDLPPKRGPEPASESRPEPGPEPQAAPPPAAAPAQPIVDSPDAALLRATQLAVAGSGREEIEAALRRDFGIDEPGEVLDRILGPDA